MEREIKFRGKMANGIWKVNKSITQRLSGKILLGGYAVNPYTIGQFTGLKDAKGKDIYEGDIIEVTSLSDTSLGTRTNAIVVFINSAFRLKHKAKEALLLTHWTEDVVKVIGNIYDNPELLKGE
jgi:uncharacterized phage protein (TIGR01671 family)